MAQAHGSRRGRFQDRRRRAAVVAPPGGQPVRLLDRASAARCSHAAAYSLRPTAAPVPGLPPPRRGDHVAGGVDPQAEEERPAAVRDRRLGLPKLRHARGGHPVTRENRYDHEASYTWQLWSTQAAAWQLFHDRVITAGKWQSDESWPF